MKLVCAFLLLALYLPHHLAAQQNHFLFIQSENRQPFNVTLQKKVYSSTATGYVIIPKLASGQYNIAVGFGGSEVPDQSFTVAIDQKDVGFNLKNFESKGWGLFNLQTMDVLMSQQSQPSETSVANTGKPSASNQNNSSNIFQPDVNSNKPSSTVENTGEKEITKPNSTPASEPVTEVAKLNENMTSTPPVTTGQPVTGTIDAANDKGAQPSTPASARKSGSVTKISELKGGEAFYITYVDAMPGGNDTISVLIPYLKLTAAEPKVETGKTDLKFLDIETSQKSEDKKVDVPGVMKGADTPANADLTPTAGTTKNSGTCNSVAGEDDFLKLRKRMAAATDNDGMLSEARKTFKTMCFTTEQVKNLAYLFLADASRYQFFDAAYPSVADPDQFGTLSIMLTDGYYINRFKAMLRN